jgi:hypothetical protein
LGFFLAGPESLQAWEEARLNVHLLDSCRRVRLHDLPALAVVQLHPVVLAILNLASALESLGEQLTQVVVVGGVLETEVTDVAKVLIELLCSELAFSGKRKDG